MKKAGNSIVALRVKAFAIDYLIILIYAGFLAGITFLISKFLHPDLGKTGRLNAEITGFLTLTLPVVLYFTVSETSRHNATIGKRKMNLKVAAKNLGHAGFWQLLLRNCIKFLPWEIAHFFIYQLLYFMRMKIESPAWVLTGLIVSQGLAILYFVFIIVNKENRSIYEMISHTRVIRSQSVKTDTI